MQEVLDSSPSDLLSVYVPTFDEIAIAVAALMMTGSCPLSHYLVLESKAVALAGLLSCMI